MLARMESIVAALMLLVVPAAMANVPPRSCAAEGLPLDGDAVSMLQVSMGQRDRTGEKLPSSLEPGKQNSNITYTQMVHYMAGEWRPATDAEAKEFLDTTNQLRCMHGSNPLKYSEDMATSASEYISPMTSMIHSKSYDLPPPAGPAGENLAIRSGGGGTRTERSSTDGGKTWTVKRIPIPAGDMTQKPSEIAEAWASEYLNCKEQSSSNSKWDGCQTKVAPTGPNNDECPAPDTLGNHGDGNECQTGHFTAIIWDGAKEMGCAFSTSTNPAVSICRYRAGNEKSEDTPNFFYRRHGETNVDVAKRHVKKQTKTRSQCKNAKPSGDWKIPKGSGSVPSGSEGRPSAHVPSSGQTPPVPEDTIPGNTGDCGPGKWRAPIKGTCACKQKECVEQKCKGKGFSWACSQSYSVNGATNEKIPGTETIVELTCAC